MQYNLTRTKRACFREGARSCIVRHVLRSVSEQMVGHVGYAGLVLYAGVLGLEGTKGVPKTGGRR